MGQPLKSAARLIFAAWRETVILSVYIPLIKKSRNELMRKIVFFTAALMAVLALPAQEVSDTTIYQVVEEMPRFPVCEQLDTTLAVKIQCAQDQLLAFVYQNVNYPFEARQNGNEGAVVVSFVVEKDGTLTNSKIVKDIGGGCGLEVLRIVNGMNEIGLKWVPGKSKGEVVRTRFNLPVRFRLEEAPPYVLVEGDTVYTQFDELLSFEGGDEALVRHLGEKVEYPETWNDSCLIGTIDIQLLVEPTGAVKVLNLTDYSNLGFDFHYEAIDAATSTMGKWTPALYQGRQVPTSYDLSIYFEPTATACKTVISNYQQATTLVTEGVSLFDEGEQEAGIAKMSEAVSMFPNNATFLYARGQAYMDMNRFPEACADLTMARDIALVDWFDSILPIICREE